MHVLLAGHCLRQTSNGAAAICAVCVAGPSVSRRVPLHGRYMRLFRLQLSRQGLALPVPGSLRLPGGAPAELCLAVEGLSQRPVLAARSFPLCRAWVCVLLLHMWLRLHVRLRLHL